MSAFALVAQPVAQRFSRPALQLIRGTVPRLSTAAFTALVMGISGFGLFAMLVVNNAIAKGAFIEASLSYDVKVAEAAQQSAQQSLSLLASPGSLEARARAMGMVPQEAPVFLRLSDGKVLGKPQPAEGAPVPKAVFGIMPQTDALAPDLQMAAAVIKAEPVPVTSDAAVELVEPTT